MGCGGSKTAVGEGAVETHAISTIVEPVAPAKSPPSAIPIKNEMSGKDRQTVAGKLRALFNDANTEGGIAGEEEQLTRDELLFHLDRKEMKLLLEESGLIDEFDVDRDGKLSITEIMNKMDENGDGYVLVSQR